MTDRIYILLPVHNRIEHTRQFIECLQSQSLQEFHLVLIDDGSRDGTAEMANQSLAAAQLTIVRGSGDLWWAGGLQAGITALRHMTPKATDIMLIINDDVRIEPDYLARAMAVLSEESECLLLSRIKDSQSGTIKESGIKADLRRFSFRTAKHPEEINCMSTRGLFMRWSDLVRLGDFHPKLLPHYLSDYEFTMRAGKLGMRYLTTDEVWLYPDETATGIHNVQGHRGRALLSIYFSKKSANNPIYLSSFALLVSPLAWLPLNLLRVWKGALWTLAKHMA